MHEDGNLSKYNKIKNELYAIYDHITEGLCIRSKCNSHEHSEKPTKCFLNLEKQREVQNTIKNNLLFMIRKLQTRHIL